MFTVGFGSSGPRWRRPSSPALSLRQLADHAVTRSQGSVCFEDLAVVCLALAPIESFDVVVPQHPDAIHGESNSLDDYPEAPAAGSGVADWLAAVSRPIGASRTTSVANERVLRGMEHLTQGRQSPGRD